MGHMLYEHIPAAGFDHDQGGDIANNFYSR